MKTQAGRLFLTIGLPLLAAIATGVSARDHGAVPADSVILELQGAPDLDPTAAPRESDQGEDMVPCAHRDRHCALPMQELALAPREEPPVYKGVPHGGPAFVQRKTWEYKIWD